MNCKKCQAQLEEGNSVCPNCGEVNEITAQESPTEEKTPIEEGAKATPGKLAIAIVAGVVVLAILVALVVNGLGGVTKPLNADSTGGTGTSTAATNGMDVTAEPTIPADGNPDDVTCKGSYTGTDDEVIAAGDTVIATMGDAVLTNADLQIHYWLQVHNFLENYGSYAMYLGLDYTQPLDTQISAADASQTWQQYFLWCALESWKTYQVMALEADAAGFQLDEELQAYVTNLLQEIEVMAADYGFENGITMIRESVGPGGTVEAYAHYLETFYKADAYYYELYSQHQISPEEVEAYFAENEEAYAAEGVSKKTVDVRHILLIPEGGTVDENGNTVYSDEEWATCLAEAEAVLEQWKNGEATEETFAEFAGEYSEDPGSNTAGGLYEDVYVGQMVEPFENWCFDETRQTGDYGIVQTSYGYHIMYFVKSQSPKFVDVRHILLTPQGGTVDENGNTVYSDEEWEICLAEAEAILKQWQDGEATEETFAELANKYSIDTGSNTVGGLYENVYEGQMVEPFENWCFDEARQVGDYGIVQTSYGYHIMYFVDIRDIWYAYAEGDLLSEWSASIVPEALTKYEVTVDYESILLGFVDLAAG